MMHHHAQLLIGTRAWALTCMPDEYRSPSADVIHHTYHRMNIADARSLIREALFRPVEGVKRVFVIEASGILGEAQNALLKLFEEPSEHVSFYLIIPREHILLPTLRSRLQLISVEEQGVHTDSFDEFRARSLRERLEEIADRLKKEDVLWVEEIVRGAIAYARSEKSPHIMRVVESADVYVRTTGASKKMLLEHLALSL